MRWGARNNKKRLRDCINFWAEHLVPRALPPWAFVFKGLKYVLCKTPFSLEMFGAFFLGDASCKNNYRILIKGLTLSCHFRVRVCFSSLTIYDNGENRIFFQWAVFTKSSWVKAYFQVKMLFISVPTVNLYSV